MLTGGHPRACPGPRTGVRAIVEGLRLAPEDRERTRRLLLDAEGRVLAAPDRRGLLRDRVALRTDGRPEGHYREADGTTVGFARTPGYETYEGLGWYGALVQAPRP